jgi:HEAT repeats
MFSADALAEQMIRVPAEGNPVLKVGELTAVAGIVLVWTACAWAQTIKQGPDTALINHDSAPAARLVKPGTAPSVAPGVFLGPAGFGVLAVIELSKDKGTLPRAIAARLPANDSSEAAREALRDALQVRSWIVRAAAAEALGFHGSVGDVATLAPMLDDQQKEVRYRAAAAIIRMSSHRGS